MNEYAKVIRLCTKAIVFFDERPYQNTNLLQVFHYSLLAKHFHLRAYARCRQVANKSKNIFQAGNYNWFKWNELCLLSELHGGRYEAAAALWEQAAARTENSDLPASIIEFWKTAGAYLYFLTQCGRLKERKTNEKFRIGKMPGEILLIQSDKSGISALLLSIQFLLALADRDYGRCMDGQEMLAQYRVRYLNPQANSRSYHFLRMLESIPHASFNQKEVTRKAFPWLQKLQTLPLEADKPQLKMEIIPYETLWALALELLN